MRFFGGRSQRQAPSDDLTQVLSLVAQTLPSDLVDDVQTLGDPERAMRVELPSVLELVRHRPRAEWASIVDAYYKEAAPRIRAADALEARATTFEHARPYLGALLEAGLPEQCGTVASPGVVPGTRFALVLEDGAAIRFVLPSMLTRWGATADDVFAAARETAASRAVSVHESAVLPGFVDVDFTPWASAGLALTVLDSMAPNAVGPLGALAAVFAPNVLTVRPLDFRPGNRAAFNELVRGLELVRAQHGSMPHARPLWRRLSGRIVEIEIDSALRGNMVTANLRDTRFRGVLTASEPTEDLAVPAWCAGLFDAEQYTRFAGVVAATLVEHGIPPDGVGQVVHELGLPFLARVCATVDDGYWPWILGMASRVTFQWGGMESPRSLEGAFLVDDLRAASGELPQRLSRLLADMPRISRAAMYGHMAVRVGAAPSAAGRSWLDGPREPTLTLLIAPEDGVDSAPDAHRLMAECARYLPPGQWCAIQRAGHDDPRLADTAHSLVLRQPPDSPSRTGLMR